MKKQAIDTIIKNGSIRKKILLYMADTANSNINGLSEEVAILNQRQRDLIYNSIKEAKDWKYYESLRNYSFILSVYKPHVDVSLVQLDTYAIMLENSYSTILQTRIFKDTINDLLEIYTNKEDRAKAIKTVTTKLTTKYQEEGFEPLIDMNMDVHIGLASDMIKELNRKAKTTKELLLGMKSIVYRYFPVKPYKDYIKESEKGIKRALNHKNLGFLAKLSETEIITYDNIKIESLTKEEEDEIKNLEI